MGEKKGENCLGKWEVVCSNSSVSYSSISSQADACKNSCSSERLKKILAAMKLNLMFESQRRYRWKHQNASAARVFDLLFSPSGFSPLSPSNGAEPPAFLEPLQDCHVDEGRDVTLRAIITGSQPVKVSWLHNGKLELFTLNHLLGIEHGALKKKNTYSYTSPDILNKNAAPGPVFN